MLSSLLCPMNFRFDGGGYLPDPRNPGRFAKITAPDVLNPVDKMPGLSTDSTSQWGHNAIEISTRCGDAL